MVSVALLSSWNACCGVSIHAELIGRALLRMGHELKVFAPREYEDCSTPLYHSQDEGFVTRNYSFLRYGDRCIDVELLDSLYFDPEPLLDGSFDLLIVEKPTSTPLGCILRILPRLKGRTRSMAILHEGRIPENPYFSRVAWDSVVVFDERFKRLFSSIFEGIHVVPFPCHPLDLRDRSKARRRLDLSEKAALVFSFGRMPPRAEALLEAMEKLRGEHPELLFLFLAGNLENYWAMRSLRGRYGFLDVRFGRPPINELYDYLRAADAIIFDRDPPPHSHLAVSSSVHLCLGALTPILCSDVPYFDTFEGEVMKHRNTVELEDNLRKALEGRVGDLLERARKFVEERSADIIAERLLEIGLHGESHS
jgi:hypothetical protein